MSVIRLSTDVIQKLSSLKSRAQFPAQVQVDAPNADGRSRTFSIEVTEHKDVKVERRLTLGALFDSLSGEMGHKTRNVLKCYTVRVLNQSGDTALTKLTPLLPKSTSLWIASAAKPLAKNFAPLTLVIDIDETVITSKNAGSKFCDEHELKYTHGQSGLKVHADPERLQQLLALQLNGHNIKVITYKLDYVDVQQIFATYGIHIEQEDIITLIVGNKVDYVERQSWEGSHLFLSNEEPLDNSSDKTEPRQQTIHKYFLGRQTPFPIFERSPF